MTWWEEITIWEAFRPCPSYSHESNNVQYVLCPSFVQIKLLVKGGKHRKKEGAGVLLVYYSHGNIVSHEQLNPPELFPKGIACEGIFRARYIFILNLWPNTISRKTTLKHLKTLCFIAPPQPCTVTIGPQMTPSRLFPIAIFTFLFSEA